jgi:hypothetical protein
MVVVNHDHRDLTWTYDSEAGLAASRPEARGRMTETVSRLLASHGESSSHDCHGSFFWFFLRRLGARLRVTSR